MISIVTVGMNHRKYIKALYESLYGEGMPNFDFEAVYVDNCSTDGSVKFLRENFPQVKVVVNTEPLGFGENNNKGVMASTGDFIGIVNPDIVIPPHCLDVIIDVLSKCRNEIICPKLLNPDGTEQYPW